MSRDTKSKMSKKETKNAKRREEEPRKKKRNEESSDDDNSFYTDDESENEMDVQEYRKFLKKIFPSKHLDKKIKAGDRLKKVISDDESYEDSYQEDDDDDESYEVSEEVSDEEEEENCTKKRKLRSVSKQLSKEKKATKKKQSKKEVETDEDEAISPKKYEKNRSTKKKQIVISDEESGEELGSEDSEEDDEEEEISPKSSKFNIIFTIGGRGEAEDNDYDEEEDEDWETDTDTDTNTENEDDPVSSESEIETEKEEEEDERKDKHKQKNKKVDIKIDKKDKREKDDKREKENKNNDEEKSTEQDEILIKKLRDVLGVKSIEKTDTNNEVITMLKDLQTRNKNNDLVNECLKVCEAKMEVNKQKQEKREKKVKARNGRIFKKILRDKNTMNDFEFYDKLETEQQKKIIKELREINKITRIEKPYRLTLLESNIPVIFKAAAMKKISSLRYMEPGSGEFYKIKNWVDTFMRIPFSEYKTLPINISDGVDNCHNFMATAQKTLDDAVYGLNDAKMQIMQMLGQLITNPKAIGSAIAIHGPPGTGKTSLVKEGISKILNRPFAFIALGGATDSSFLEGHGYTYEGSTWGKIVQILIDSKCMNPVIYFDELDKISDTPKGEEIAGILTHLTDTSQNSQFHDKYFAEIDFDLSKCLFIFSYNDESKVNPILKDRMYRIQTKGYNQKQKTTISNNYLLPKIREQVKFDLQDIIIPDQTLHYIIENHCNKEDGVRNLKRCLEIIYTKLNLYRLMRPDSNLFEEDMSIKVTFPFTVTKEIVDKMIKKTDNGLNPSLYHLYM
jgi:ATP-dependent Lon protease